MSWKAWFFLGHGGPIVWKICHTCVDFNRLRLYKLPRPIYYFDNQVIFFLNCQYPVDYVVLGLRPWMLYYSLAIGVIFKKLLNIYTGCFFWLVLPKKIEYKKLAIFCLILNWSSLPIIGYVLIWSSLIFSKCETRPPINRLWIHGGGDQFQGQKKWLCPTWNLSEY